MRIALVAASACAFAACTTSGHRSRTGSSETAPPPAAHAPAPAPVVAEAPALASRLAREAGLGYEDTKTSVLLSTKGLLVRIFPGSDSLSVNGNPVPMGEPARRDGPEVVVPVAGVRIVRRELSALRARSVAVAMAPPPFRPVAVRIGPPPPAAHSARPAAVDSVPAAWKPAVTERKWRWIVIHHSADVSGCAAKYEAVHRGKGWDGLGYHFVIGNGSQSGDGAVEVGYRWAQQEHGAHARRDPSDDNRFNEYGIGIVLVGNFEACGGPSRAQYQSVVRLTRWLMARYALNPDRVMPHSDVKATCCPGPGFPWSRFLADVASPPALPGE